MFNNRSSRIAHPIIASFVIALLESSAIPAARAAPASQAACFADAASRFHVSENLLRAIAKVESNFDPEAVNPSSRALGVMQIHPSNFVALGRYGITEKDLRDPCTNIHVGAWLLAGFIRQYGAVWRAVGGFGAGNGKRRIDERNRAAYVAKVQDTLYGRKPKSPSPAVPTAPPSKPSLMVIE